MTYWTKKHKESPRNRFSEKNHRLFKTTLLTIALDAPQTNGHFQVQSGLCDCLINAIKCLEAQLFCMIYGGKQKLPITEFYRFAQTSLGIMNIKNVLIKRDFRQTVFFRLAVDKVGLKTTQNSEISLSAFDDQRFIQVME